MPLSRGPAGRAIIRVLLVATMIVTVGAVAHGGAEASPRPSPAQVREQVVSLREQAEAATERFNAARETLASLNIRLTGAEARLAEEREALQAARAELGRIAADTYKAGDLATLSLFLGDNPDGYVSANGILVSLGDRRAEAVSELTHRRQLLVGSMTDLQAQRQRLQQTEQTLLSSKRDVERKLNEAAALLQQLSPEQRRELDRDATAKDRTDLVSAGITVPASGQLTCKDVPLGALGARASKAIDYACGQLGDPYQWGASGPTRFDCSGLTMMAWRQAGVSLPHNAAMQATYGTKVSINNLRPGDLVFFYDPIGHNGIYLGSGLMLHAPRTGDVVKIAPMRYIGTFATAVRL